MRIGHRNVDAHDVRSEALRALGGGVAMIGSDGLLVAADSRFLELHGVPSEGDGASDPVGRCWPVELA